MAGLFTSQRQTLGNLRFTRKDVTVTADINPLDTGGYSSVRLEGTPAAFQLLGIQTPTDPSGYVVEITNATGVTCTILNDQATTAAYGIYCPTGTTIEDKRCAEFKYDSDYSRWVLKNNTVGASSLPSGVVQNTKGSSTFNVGTDFDEDATSTSWQTVTFESSQPYVNLTAGTYLLSASIVAYCRVACISHLRLVEDGPTAIDGTEIIQDLTAYNWTLTIGPVPYTCSSSKTIAMQWKREIAGGAGDYTTIKDETQIHYIRLY